MRRSSVLISDRVAMNVYSKDCVEVGGVVPQLAGQSCAQALAQGRSLFDNAFARTRTAYTGDLALLAWATVIASSSHAGIRSSTQATQPDALNKCLAVHSTDRRLKFGNGC